ncbi:MAG: hypothetical protein R3C19_06705 [Planctomycetaceae bacterium]
MGNDAHVGSDIGRFLDGEFLPRGRVVKPETAALMTRNHNKPDQTSRGLGFNVGVAGRQYGLFRIARSATPVRYRMANPATQITCVVLTSLPGRAVATPETTRRRTSRGGCTVVSRTQEGLPDLRIAEPHDADNHRKSLIPEFDMEYGDSQGVERVPTTSSTGRFTDKSNTIGYWSPIIWLTFRRGIEMTIKHDSLDVHPPGGEPFQSPKETKSTAAILRLFDTNVAEGRRLLLTASTTKHCFSRGLC